MQDKKAHLRKGGNKRGSKRTSTIIRQLYEGGLSEIAQHRLGAVLEQVARDALNEDLDLRYRQKAQQMLLQAAQKAVDSDIQQDALDNKEAKPVDIKISRDGVLIQSGQDRYHIDGTAFNGERVVSQVDSSLVETKQEACQINEGGVGQRQAGVDDEVVPYTQYTADQSPNNQSVKSQDLIPYSFTTLDSEGNKVTTPPSMAVPRLKWNGEVMCAPNTRIGLHEFVGPLHRIHHYRYFSDIPSSKSDEFLSREFGYSECYCIDRPDEMTFNYEVLDERG